MTATVLPFRAPTAPTTQRIYFPVDDEYVVVGHIAPGSYTAHMETGDGCGHGSTMLEAIADLVEAMGREECN